MNSVTYRVANPWGLHARPCAFIVRVTAACASRWEVVAASRGQEVDAKSIIGLMTLVVDYGSEIEFLSLMPAEAWDELTASLESLFFVVDHQGKKANAYDPVEKSLQAQEGAMPPACSTLRSQLHSRSARYNCGPILERLSDVSIPSTPAELPTRSKRPPPEQIDTFISYDSRDFSYAMRIYDALLDRGFGVFLAGASLHHSGDSDFQLGIESALNRASSMVVAATKPEHLEGGWVRAEWTTFLNEKRAGRKTGNLVTIRPQGVAITNLPLMLRMFQSEELSPHGPVSAAGVDRLVSFLGVSIKSVSPPNPAEEP